MQINGINGRIGSWMQGAVQFSDGSNCLSSGGLNMYVSSLCYHYKQGVIREQLPCSAALLTSQ